MFLYVKQPFYAFEAKKKSYAVIRFNLLCILTNFFVFYDPSRHKPVSFMLRSLTFGFRTILDATQPTLYFHE